MNKPIVLDNAKWEQLYTQIKQDYPLSTVLIRSRMRETLGFTPREHKEWTPNGNDYYGHLTVTMRLDFYDEPKRLMFLLKYGEFLEKNKLEGMTA